MSVKFKFYPTHTNSRTFLQSKHLIGLVFKFSPPLEWFNTTQLGTDMFRRNKTTRSLKLNTEAVVHSRPCDRPGVFKFQIRIPQVGVKASVGHDASFGQSF
jgi:hypothetical protein